MTSSSTCAVLSVSISPCIRMTSARSARTSRASGSAAGARGFRARCAGGALNLTAAIGLGSGAAALLFLQRPDRTFGHVAECEQHERLAFLVHAARVEDELAAAELAEDEVGGEFLDALALGQLFLEQRAQLVDVPFSRADLAKVNAERV